LPNLFALIEGKVKSILFGNDGTTDKKIKTKTDGTLLVEIENEQVLVPKPYFSVEETVVSVENDKEYLLGAVIRDIHIQTNKKISVKFNSTSSPSVVLPNGYFNFEKQFANKIYITTTLANTKIGIYANG